MDTGNDGRFYDSHYDFNNNGHLDLNEQLLYDDDVYGHGSGGYRRSREPRVKRIINGSNEGITDLVLRD